MSKRPTMSDVACYAGVSRQLVSMVLRNVQGPSPETRQRILQAADELGYHPDRYARLLRGNRSYLVGVLFSMHEPFEVDVVEQLSASARRQGYSLVLGPWGSTRSQSDVLCELLEQRVEALFVLSCESGEAAITDFPEGLPTIYVGGPTGSATDDDIRVDDTIGVEKLVEHLVSQGHKHITHVSGGSGPNASTRETAYREAMVRRGLDQTVVRAGYSEEAGYRAAQAILESDEAPTAIMAANDRCAVGVLAALSEHRRDFSSAVSVTGFDDSYVASWPFTQLTTIRVDPVELAEIAVRTAISRICGDVGPPRRVMVKPNMVVRTSSGPV